MHHRNIQTFVTDMNEVANEMSLGIINKIF